jgi:hypothetical protein
MYFELSSRDTLNLPHASYRNWMQHITQRQIDLPLGKGQEISKEKFDGFISSKMRIKFFEGFLP